MDEEIRKIIEAPPEKKEEPEKREEEEKEVHLKFKPSSMWKTSTYTLLVLFVASLLTGGFGFISDSNSNTGDVIAPTNVPAPSPTPKAQVSADDDAFKGDADAPVTIIEFSDYECPFCGRFYSQTLPQITSEYIDTGKVKFVYRDFPLGFHPQAQKSAEAAECAGEQDKYFEMHDLLFEKGVSGGVSSFKQYAKDIGLNTGEFDDCLDSGEMADEVKKDAADGQSYGVSGTPATFVNGRLISGAQPFSAFKAIIDEELAK